MKQYKRWTSILAVALAVAVAGALWMPGASWAAESCTQAATVSPFAAAPDVASLQGPEVVGEEILATYSSPAVAASGGELASERLVWTQTISYAGASYIAPHFASMNLPDGARLVLRSPDGSRSWEYRGRGKADLGPADDFWGIHIAGDEAVLELYATGKVGADAVVIDSFARGYDQGDVVSEPEAICGGDDAEWAQCYQSSEPTIYAKGRAVARLLMNGTSACTGWLVGDEGHLMTNEHCIGSASTANNTNYEFLAEGSCGTNCASWFACPGTIVASSATLVQLDATLDYTLVKLPVNVSGTYGYLQMRNSGASVGERIYIPQHAAAWGKRIAVASDNANDGSGLCEVYTLNSPPCSGGSGNDVGYFCDTQGGSSGSPVLGYSDHAVVALHHCANCPNRGVPIQAVIADLGSNVPNNGTTGGGCTITEPTEVSCSDGVDNDCDGLTDAADPDCATCTITEPVEVSCSDGIDNDCDGLTDLADPDCALSCGAKGDACTADGDCCSNKCKGKRGNKSCR